MPPIILLAMAGAGFYAGYRLLLAKASEKASQPNPDEVRAPGTKNLGELEWDAKAGVYRPKSGS